jgi:hypothetical protein
VLLFPISFAQPGHEGSFGTPSGRLAERVNANGGIQPLREGTIVHAMAEYIKAPHADFQEAIVEHFRMKREYIAGVLLGWLREVGPLQ